MPAQVLQGSVLRAEDKLERLRKQIYDSRFDDADEIRQFVNRYVSVHPDQLRGRSGSVVDEVVGSIRAELGLPIGASPGAVSAIPTHVRDLVVGRAQASEDTSLWAVHHAANQVMMYSGQFVYEAEDIVIDGAGMDFKLRRVYKSQGFHNGPLGIDWDHSFNLWLRTVDDERIVCLSGGFQESEYVRHDRYGQAGLNYWVPPPGEHRVIFELDHIGEYRVAPPPNCASCRYGLRLPNGTVHYFHDQGDAIHYRVHSIVDRFGNYLGFVHDEDAAGVSRLRQVVINSPARQVQFEYDALGRIVVARDYLGRAWRYAYDDFGDLVAFTTPGTARYPAGLTERYRYSTSSHGGELGHKLIEVYDTAGRSYLQNEYGTDPGLLSFGRVVRQREGSGERVFEYEDVSLVAGLPAGQPEVEAELPVHQTIMARRNGQPVHYVYNRLGNLLAREEDAWAGGGRRRLVAHYRYNRDGALIGEITPKGRTVQYLYGRDVLMHQVGDLPEPELRRLEALTWQTRLGFGNRVAVVHRSRAQPQAAFQFPSPLRDVYAVATRPEDIVVKLTYDPAYQSVTGVSHPRYTRSPLPGARADSPRRNPAFARTLTTFRYDGAGRLRRITYPATTRDGQPELQDVHERLLAYDARGRLLEYANRAGVHTRLTYFTANEGAKEGYLQRQIVDPKRRGHPNGLDLRTEYEINGAGLVTCLTTYKKDTANQDQARTLRFEIDELNRVTTVTRSLPPRVDPQTGRAKPAVDYQTRFTYCRNMRVERIDRDLQDDEGQPVWGGTEVQFFDYDQNDNVCREQRGGPDPSGQLVTRHTYTDGQLRARTLLPRGNAIRIDYDERRLPVRITRGVSSPEAVVVAVAYDGDALITERRDGRGLRAVFARDSFGRVVRTEEYDAHDDLYRLVRHDYDKAGNLTCERVFIPNGTSFKLLSHAQFIADELNQRIEVRVRRSQEPIVYSARDVDRDDDEVPVDQAVRTRYFYDPAGRLTRVEQVGRRLDPHGQPEPNETALTTMYAYDAAGRLVSETDPLGNETRTRYDEHGLVTEVDICEKVARSPTGFEVFTARYAFDALDRLESSTDSLGNITRFEYDSRDAVVRQIDPLGNVIRFEYDVYGRQIAERVEMTDTGLGGGPRQPDSDVVTRFVYDANGNLVRLIDGHGTPTDQDWDALDRRTTIRHAPGTATIYVYDGNDNVVEQADCNGLIMRSAYDPLDRPLSVEVDTSALAPGLAVEGASDETFEYDALGQMTRARNAWADIHFKVDSLGRTYEESVQLAGLGRAFTLRRHYDDFGFLRRLVYPNGRVITYQPDALNRITRVLNQAYGIGYPGDAALPPTRPIVENEYRGLRVGVKRRGNGSATRFAYDGAGRTIEIAHTRGRGTTLLAVQHLYDAAGNMRATYEYAARRRPYGERYTYDSRHQLIRYEQVAPPDRFDTAAFAPRTAPPADGSACQGQRDIDACLGRLSQGTDLGSFTYDKLGNRLEERRPDEPQPVTYVANELNQYLQRDTTQYRYDPAGNLCEAQAVDGASHYAYNHRHQLARVTRNGSSLTFRYDALGRHIMSRAANVTTHYLYDDENVVEERRLPPAQLSGELIAQYVHEFEVASHHHLAALGTEYWYHKDLVGSTRMLSGFTNQDAHYYRYSPFGVLTSRLPDVPNPYLFAGRRYITPIDLYSFRARCYDPNLGRFLERDPSDLGDHTNLYHYVENAPLTRVDPDGSDWFDVVVPARRIVRLYGQLAAGSDESRVSAARALIAEREIGRNYLVGVGEGIVNLIPGAIQTLGNVASGAPLAIESSTQLTPAGPREVWSLRSKDAEWYRGVLGAGVGETVAAAWVASDPSYSTTARLQAGRRAGQGTPGTVATLLGLRALVKGRGGSINEPAGSGFPLYFSSARPRRTTRPVLGQERNWYYPETSCVQTSGLMVLVGYGLSLGVEFIRKLAGSSAAGTYLGDLASALRTVGLKARYRRQSSIADLAKATARGEPAVVQIEFTLPSLDIARHAVVVDFVTTRPGMGRVVATRDPSGPGRSIYVPVDEFRAYFTGEAVFTTGTKAKMASFE